MENMDFQDRNELIQFISDHSIKRFTVGREGVCSLLDNGYVIKYLYDDYYPKFALQFKDVENDSFIFAKNAAFIKDYVAALFMEYAEGPTVEEKKPDDLALPILGSQLDKLVRDIKKISDMGIYVKDFTCGNIIHKPDQFKVIDTTPYLYLPKGNYRKENMSEIMNRLYDGILEEVMKYRRELGNDCIYRGRQEHLENPSEYLSKLKSIIENNTKQEITTLEDAAVALKKRYPR